MGEPRLGVPPLWDRLEPHDGFLHLHQADGLLRHPDLVDAYLVGPVLVLWRHVRTRPHLCDMLTPDQRDQIEAIVRLLLVGAIWGVMALGYLALMKLDGNC